MWPTTDPKCQDLPADLNPLTQQTASEEISRSDRGFRKAINEPGLCQGSVTLASLRTHFPPSLPPFLKRRFWRILRPCGVLQGMGRDGSGAGSHRRDGGTGSGNSVQSKQRERGEGKAGRGIIRSVCKWHGSSSPSARRGSSATLRERLL